MCMLELALWYVFFKVSFFLSVPFIVLLLFSAMTAAIAVSTHLLRLHQLRLRLHLLRLHLLRLWLHRYGCGYRGFSWSAAPPPAHVADPPTVGSPPAPAAAPPTVDQPATALPAPAAAASASAAAPPATTLPAPAAAPPAAGCSSHPFPPKRSVCNSRGLLRPPPLQHTRTSRHPLLLLQVRIGSVLLLWSHFLESFRVIPCQDSPRGCLWTESAGVGLPSAVWTPRTYRLPLRHTQVMSVMDGPTAAAVKA